MGMGKACSLRQRRPTVSAVVLYSDVAPWLWKAHPTPHARAASATAPDDVLAARFVGEAYRLHAMEANGFAC